MNTPTVRLVSLPADAGALSTLPRIDYADAFCVAADVPRTAEHWLLQDAPPHVRRRLLVGWTAIGLKLAPWSSNRVLARKVRHSEPDFVLLSADSWLGLRGELLFRSTTGWLLFATFVEQTNPITRALWAAITPGHQDTVRSVLTHAARW
jgi:hypothetical protein